MSKNKPLSSLHLPVAASFWLPASGKENMKKRSPLRRAYLFCHASWRWQVMGVPFRINILSLQMLICFFVVLCVFYCLILLLNWLLMIFLLKRLKMKNKFIKILPLSWLLPPYYKKNENVNTHKGTNTLFFTCVVFLFTSLLLFPSFFLRHIDSVLELWHTRVLIPFGLVA